ncbi:hypothetical protein TSAR_005524 [Trichomalopsis sarcophagae]|uniref:Uncharacterized protein n=1 Tax=Trichomalopsis sarcophagae TaxID=543379 RepID=A0A232EW17_9HYME|nr:hypothetical protein TSAR_005524 [Trichomalopsis sarcophagae]
MYRHDGCLPFTTFNSTRTYYKKKNKNKKNHCVRVQETEVNVTITRLKTKITFLDNIDRSSRLIVLAKVIYFIILHDRSYLRRRLIYLLETSCLDQSEQAVIVKVELLYRHHMVKLHNYICKLG